MILDQAIYAATVTGVIMALFVRVGIVPALAISISMVINLWLKLTLGTNGTWGDLAAWAALFSAKDLLLLTLFGFMRNTAALIILLSFAVSCLFHQAILAQVLTHESSNLTLFAIRPTVMKYVSVVQLATVFYIILTGSGFNGGKRAKHWLYGLQPVVNNLLYIKTFKVKK